MSLRGVVLSSERDALALIAKVDAALGLPRCNCEKCGGPKQEPCEFRPKCLCNFPSVNVDCLHVTRTHSIPEKRIDSAAWVVPLGDAVAESKVDALDGVVSTLDRADWAQVDSMAAVTTEDVK